MRFAVVALVAALAACSPPAEKTSEKAAANVKPKAGQWRTTVTMLDLPAEALALMKTPTITTGCMTSDAANLLTGMGAQHGDTCTVIRAETGGGRIDEEISCVADGVTQSMKMTGAFGAERVEMIMDVSTQTPDGPRTHKTLMLSERIGDCPGAQQASQTPPQVAWQKSWPTFVADWNACLDGCDRQAFADKAVEWEGVLSHMAEPQSGQLLVYLTMPGALPRDRAGVAGNKLLVGLRPTPAQQAAWRSVAPGQTVRFRSRTVAGYGGVVGFTRVGGDAIAMVNTEGAELLARP